MSDLLKLLAIGYDGKVSNRVGVGTTTAGHMDLVVGVSTTSPIDVGYTYNDDGTFTAPPLPPAKTAEELWADLRGWRDGQLLASDWVMIPDTPFSDSKREEWKTYRQALRDLPTNTSDISNPSYPTRPS